MSETATIVQYRADRMMRRLRALDCYLAGEDDACTD